MTFIASFKSKKGVALIADSLVTSTRNILEVEDFLKYIGEKGSQAGKEIKIDTKEIMGLFKSKPSHTKDYEEKLFQYDKYTAITTAGAASINDKRIEKVVQEAITKYKTQDKRNKKSFDTKLNEFCTHLKEEIKNHLKNKSSIRATTFIVTNYSVTKKETTIYKIEIIPASQKNMEEKEFELIKILKQPDEYKVVCDGQNRISERILFGEMYTIVNFIPRIVQKIAEDFGIEKNKISGTYISELFKNKSVVTRAEVEDMKMFKLTELSLQQAVDLACLLMRIEIDIQKYTETIPTVGGVIKVAVIDDEGFRYVSGNELNTNL